MDRRGWLLLTLALARRAAAQEVWRCPMDTDVRAAKPGNCPRCGMALVTAPGHTVEYRLAVATGRVRAGEPAMLELQVSDPRTGEPVRHFDVVHEKLMHLFVVSENLEYFLHDHPAPQADGSFRLEIRVPFGGMYRVLADFAPRGSAPQLALQTFYAEGRAAAVKVEESLAPAQGENLAATLRLEPERPLAGLESRLIFTLEPAEGLEPYLGAWGHMLAASADLIDLLHVHPFSVRGNPVEFVVIFPRPGLYRIWTQFQRAGVVNTVQFTVRAGSL